MKSFRSPPPTLVLSALLCASPAMAQTWTQTEAPITNWTALACSADGTKVVATVYGGGIYVSTNSGVDWTQTVAPQETWQAVASSADGSRLVAASYYNGDHIYTSTNSGLSWALTSALGHWTALASSADGTMLVASSYGSGFIPDGSIFTSFDGGATWNHNAPYDYFFHSVASSADGNHLVATAYYEDRFGRYGATYASTNKGATWPNMGSDGMSVACSADGSKLFLARFGIGIKVSSDSGATWADSTAPSGWWSSVACSADAVRVVAAAGGWHFNYPYVGSIYTSSDSGVTWSSNTAPTAVWQCVASSADGCKLVAAVYGGGIYTLQTTPAPVLNMTQPGNTLLISWTVPSIKFVLEESADLTNWSDVGATPVMNYADLHYEVTRPLPTAPRFYRLASQQ